MKVLTICSGNSGKISPFVQDQVDSLRKLGVKIEIFTIKGKGILGYLKNFSNLKKQINEFEPNLIHAHYGFSGLLSSLQMKVPTITTYHGSDINKTNETRFSLNIRFKGLFTPSGKKFPLHFFRLFKTSKMTKLALEKMKEEQEK